MLSLGVTHEWLLLTLSNQIREEQKQRKVRLGIQAASTLETERAGAGGSRKESKAAAEEEEDEAEQQRSIGEVGCGKEKN